MELACTDVQRRRREERAGAGGSPPGYGDERAGRSAGVVGGTVLLEPAVGAATMHTVAEA